MVESSLGNERGEKKGWDLGKRRETDGATLTVLFLSRESHGCSTSSIRERAGLNTFCSAHTAILCSSGFKGWQWTCSFYFCPHIQLLGCQLTLFLAACAPAVQGRAGQVPRQVRSPSPPRSGSFRKLSLWIVLIFEPCGFSPTTLVHA